MMGDMEAKVDVENNVQNKRTMRNKLKRTFFFTYIRLFRLFGEFSQTIKGERLS